MRDFNLDDVEVVEVLGKGSFGKVSHVLVGDTSYALKAMGKRRFLKTPCTNNSYLVWNERNCMITCESKFVLPLTATGQTEEDLLMLSPLFPGGDMLRRLKFVHNASTSDMTSYEVEFYLAQLALALEHLQSHKMVHRDIKPDNIFFDACGNAVLGDLGLATEINPADAKHSSRQWGKCGSYGYRAPEVVTSKSCGYYSDIYSLGISLYFYAFGGVPWSETSKRLAREERSGKTSLFFPSGTNMSDELCDLLAQMLEVKPEKRITIPEIKAHPCLRWVDWDKLAAGDIKTPWTPQAMPSISTLRKKARKFEKKHGIGFITSTKLPDRLPITDEEQENFKDFEYPIGKKTTKSWQCIENELTLIHIRIRDGCGWGTCSCNTRAKIQEVGCGSFALHNHAVTWQAAHH
jgi:serine/threonine protein kinase